jgi:hypothetical protein
MVRNRKSQYSESFLAEQYFRTSQEKEHKKKYLKKL